MKKTFLNSCIVLMAATVLTSSLQSCSKIARLFNYNLAMQSASVTVSIPPSSTLGKTIVFGSMANSYNVDSFIRASTLGTMGINNITSIKLMSCVLTLQNPTPTDNFANLSSCSASFSTNNENPYEISVSNNPDVYATSLTLPVDTSVQLKSYINGNDFNYSLGGQLRRASKDTLQCTIQFTYSINVQG